MTPPGTGTPSWVSYTVALGVGLAFSSLLMLLAWRSVLEQEQRQFAFESASLGERVRAGVDVSIRAAETTASLMGARPGLTQDDLQRFAQPLLSRSPFVESLAAYAPAAESAPESRGREVQTPTRVPPQQITRQKMAGPLSLRFHAAQARSKSSSDVDQEAIPSDLSEAFDLSARTHEPVLIPLLPQPAAAACCFALVKAQTAETGQVQGAGDAVLVSGAAVVTVRSEQLLAAQANESALSLLLLHESQSLNGRQVLYSRPEAARSGWMLTRLSERSTVEQPPISLNLLIYKYLYWGQLDSSLLVAAGILGLGVMLLLVALAHAKESQAWVLERRHREIERRVAQQTAELAATRDQALEASRIKSEFLASMSHEIRTPLNAIIGMAELLGETPLNREQDNYVGVFHRAAEALLGLVNDILDLTKIEASQLVLEHIDFDLSEILGQAVEIHALTSHEKDVELACQIDADVPLRLRGDPVRLRQIILNLVGNAVKFTEKGEIVVKVWIAPEAESPEHLLFSVRDTGIGIPPEKLEAIFESFTQVDSSTTRKYGGTGLGLTISKRLVEMMGGKIWVESNPGAGSAFSFTARFAPAEASVGAAAALGGLAQLRVLVADDNSTNRMILRQILEQEGALVSEAADGRQAWAEFQREAGMGTAFQLVILDGSMPGLDGFAVAEAIKRAGGNSRALMMLSSVNLGKDIARARALEMGAYLVKPVKRAELLKAIDKSLAGIPETFNRRASPFKDIVAKLQAPRILLVEDQPDNRLLVRAFLKGEAYAIEETENGELAVEAFKTNPHDLVIMDIQMPVMDGHEATRQIRAWEQEQGRSPVPIIALTAHAIKEDVQRSLDAGCTEHLTKPIKKAVLLQALKNLL